MTATDLAPALRALREAFGVDAWRDAHARIGSPLAEAGAGAGATTTAFDESEDAWPPENLVIEGDDWTDIRNAAHESGWSDSMIRKYRHRVGVKRSGIWYISRRRLAELYPRPKPSRVKSY